MSSKVVTIDPLTRLEGLAKISIVLNDEGNVKDAYYQVVELRGFERFVLGRPIEEVLRITPRICGVCPVPHHLAPAKAADQIYGVDPPRTAKLLREMLALGHNVHSHILHFYAFALPDFVLGEKTKPGTHNILGIYQAFPDVAKEAIKVRGYAQKIQAMIGGKATHPVTVIPGGVSKSLTKEQAEQILQMSKEIVEFGKLSLQVFNDLVVKNKDLMAFINLDAYKMESYYKSVVGPDNELDFYPSDTIKIIDSKGKQVAKYEAKDYLDHLAEHVEPWSYLKFPYLKKIGWKGLEANPDSGLYRVNSLARLNVVDKIKTPLAQDAFEEMFQVLGGKPAHHTLGFNWARLVELLYCGERMIEIAEEPEFYSENCRTKVDKRAFTGEGVGVIEAPRGTLYHHYQTDDNARVRKANIIVATTNNNAAICLSVKQAAQEMIKLGQYNDDGLNKIEMAFRAYDPCLACATHSLPGQMPISVEIYDHKKHLIKVLNRKK